MGRHGEELLREAVANQPPGQAEFVESLLVPIVGLFGLLQKQMVEKFNENVLSLHENFGAMHQDHMRLVREELDEIRRLSQELRSLQEEAPRRPSGAPNPATGNLASSRGGPGDFPWTMRPEETANGATRHDAASRSNGRPGDQPGNLRSDVSPAGAINPASPPTGNGARSVKGPDLESDIHALLSQRILEIQDERQSRWQKLLNMVMGP